MKTGLNSFQLICSRLKSFRRDNKGVAALEFAIISPILILMFLGTIEISLAVAVDRKVSRVSSAVADLITQHDERDLSPAFLDAMSKIADRIIYPYEDDLSIVLTGVSIENGNANVEWSWASGSTPNAVGTSFDVPESIKIDGSFLVSAKVETEHEPAFKFVNYANGHLSFDTSSILLGEEMFLRPRMFREQTCITC